MIKAELGKDQESIQLSTIPDPEHHMGTWQKAQETTTDTGSNSSALSGDHKAAGNRLDTIAKINMKYKITKKIHNRSTALEWS